MNLTGWVSVCVVLLIPTVYSKVVTFIVDVSPNNEEYIYQFQESIKAIEQKLKELPNEYQLVQFDETSHTSSDVLDVDGFSEAVQQIKVVPRSYQNCSSNVFMALNYALNLLIEDYYGTVYYVITSSYANDYNETVNKDLLQNIQERNPQINFIIGRLCNKKMADIYRDTVINTYGQMYYVDHNPADLRNIITNMFLKLDYRARATFYEPFYGNGTYKVEISPYLVAAQIEITSDSELISTRVLDKENYFVIAPTVQAYNFHQYIIKTENLISVEIEVRSKSITIVEVLFVPDFQMVAWFCVPGHCQNDTTLRPRKETTELTVYIGSQVMDYRAYKIEVFPQLSPFHFQGKSVDGEGFLGEFYKFVNFNPDGLSNFAIKVFVKDKNTNSRVAVFTRVQHKILNFVLH